MGLGIVIAANQNAAPELAEANLVEVIERLGEPTTYRLHYDLTGEDEDFPQLFSSSLGPGSELRITVPIDDQNHCLVTGPVYGQHIRLVPGADGSSLVVHGADTSITMDRETRSEQWTDVTDSSAISSVLGRYNYQIDVESTDAGHYEDKHTLIQRETDFHFVRRLARRNGYLFWVTSHGEGRETAHVRPPPVQGTAASSLSVSAQSPNVESFELSFNVELPTSIVGAQLDLNSKESMDGNVATSPVTTLGDLGLQAITGDTRSIHLGAAVDDAGDLQARGKGVLTESGWFIRAACETSVHALGGLVRAHTLVRITGAGARHSGSYLVSEVHHRITGEGHTMALILLRNGWLAQAGEAL